MPRPRNAIPSRRTNIALPAAEAARLELHLWSEAQQRVPDGAWAQWVAERVREFFGHSRVDLALYMPELPPGSTVQGTPDVIELLKRRLHG